MSASVKPWHCQAGFSLLEALITMVILAFGLLGLAGFQVKTQVLETEAYQRAQAILLVQDMANRISANRTNVTSYLTSAVPLGLGDTQPASCSAALPVLLGADLDKCEWSNELKGAAETKTQGSTISSVGSMTDARGCIDVVAGSNPPVYRVSVAWQGMSVLTVPSIPCGATKYGNNDGYRRAFAVTVPIANLASP